MSLAASAWAFDQKGLHPRLKYVLIILADYHQPEGDCLVSIDHLAEVTGLSADQVRDDIVSLAAIGLLSIDGAASYRLGCNSMAPDQMDPGAMS